MDGEFWWPMAPTRRSTDSVAFPDHLALKKVLPPNRIFEQAASDFQSLSCQFSGPQLDNRSRFFYHETHKQQRWTLFNDEVVVIVEDYQVMAEPMRVAFFTRGECSSRISQEREGINT